MTSLTLSSDTSVATNSGGLREMREALTIREEAFIGRTWLERRALAEKHLRVSVEQRNAAGEWSYTSLDIQIS